MKKYGMYSVMPVPVVKGGDNLPYPVGIGLTDLPNIVLGSGITAIKILIFVPSALLTDI